MRATHPDDWRPSEGISLDTLTLRVVKETTSAAVVAGPGAGKTELLAQRASFLLQTDLCPAPRRILAISFKRDAAKNLRDRVHARVGPELARRLESYTFEAFAKGLLDRFSSALPIWCRPTRVYRIIFPRYSDWREFADGQPFDVNGQQVERRHVRIGTAGPLPAERPSPTEDIDRAVLAWWERSITRQPSELTFGMISVLAATILRHNPMIAGALRRTYSHVFLDEFQDTTSLQYQLVCEAFQGTTAVVTAVGDTKQQIMKWAGALPGNFPSFVADFGAADHRLTVNFRSNRRIVEIVNAMARKLEPDAVRVVCARSNDAPPGLTDGVLRYSGTGSEAQGLAAWIASEVETELRRPEDFLLLVRQNANLVEDDLTAEFAARGLVLRNEARVVGSIPIQELMTEPFADLIIAVIQIAANERDGQPFQKVWEALSAPFGLDGDRPEPQLRLEQAIRLATSNARGMISAVAPADTNVRDLVTAIIKPIGQRALMQLASDYENEDRLDLVINSVMAFLEECAGNAGSWMEAIGSFLGRSQIRLMTVHKSKGLEAHTVVFLHLQDDAFHHNSDLADEKLTFFVAASRARERFFVTTTSAARQRVRPLWEMVDAAGVPELPT